VFTVNLTPLSRVADIGGTGCSAVQRVRGGGDITGISFSGRSAMMIARTLHLVSGDDIDERCQL
jgi:hypothetical protein